MAIEYLGLSEINGPLVVLEGVKNASFDEIVEFRVDDGSKKLGRIVEIYEEKAVIQVFEGTEICLFPIPTHASVDILWKWSFLPIFWDVPLTVSENPLTD